MTANMRWKTCLMLLLTASMATGAEHMPSTNVLDHGAVGDGRTDNATAIRSAIESCARDGGGTVLIPPGRFVSGPLELRDHVELHIASGAVLVASTSLDDYTIDGRKRGLIYAADATHVAVTGVGVIEGNGSHFMTDTPKPLENTSGQYARQGEAYQAGEADGPMEMGPRPGSLISLSKCRNVTIRDITIMDAPEWTIRLSECDGGLVSGISILNNPLIPNNDGIHCVTSRNIRIADCDVRAGDDAIAITGLYGTPGAATENITVTNCTLRSRSSGVRVGYGSNDMRRLTFSNLVIHESNRGLGVFVREEGSVTDVLFSNIVIHTRLHTGDWWGNGEPIHVSAIRQKPDVELGRIENVRFDNIIADSEHGIVVWGTAESPIRNLSFTDLKLRIRRGPLNDRFGGNFDLRPTREDRWSIFGHDIAGFYAGHVDRLRIEDFTIEWADDLPEFFTNGIMCERFTGLTIDGFQGRQAHPAGSSDEAVPAAIALSNGSGVMIHGCRAAPGTSTFIAASDVATACLLADNDLTNVRQVFSAASPNWKLEGNLRVLPEG